MSIFLRWPAGLIPVYVAALPQIVDLLLFLCQSSLHLRPDLLQLHLKPQDFALLVFQSPLHGKTWAASAGETSGGRAGSQAPPLGGLSPPLPPGLL